MFKVNKEDFDRLEAKVEALESTIDLIKGAVAVVVFATPLVVTIVLAIT